jgi:capsular exopolysaccharide synthesis family protein
MTAVNLGLHAAGRWWKFCLPVGLVLGGIAASFVWSRFVPMYQSEAMLLIQSRAPYIVFGAADGLSTSIATQLQILKTAPVLRSALDSLGSLDEVATHPDAVGWLKEGLSVARDGRSELFYVRFQHADPASAQKVVNAVVTSYMNFIEESDQSDTAEVIRLLQDHETEHMKTIETMKENLRDQLAQHSGDDASLVATSNARLQQSLAGRLNEQLANVIVEQKVLEAELQVAEALAEADDTFVPTAEMMRQAESHPEVERLKSAIASAEASLANMEETLVNPQSSSFYRQLTRDIKEAQTQLESTRQKVLESLGSIAAAENQSRRQQKIKDLKLNLTALATRQQALAAELNTERGKLRKSGGESLDLEFLRADLEREQHVYQLISNRKNSLLTERGAPSGIRKMTEASLPIGPVEAVPTKKLVMAGTSGLLLPFVLAIAWEHTRRRVGDTAQLRRSNVRVVGEVATLPGTSMGLMRNRPNRRQSLFEESVHSLCTRLRMAKDLRHIQVLSVCSAVSREGKTSLASQVAISVAKSTGQSTLLIDADMRSPDIYQIFEIQNEPGLAQILSRDCDYQEAIVKNYSDVLHILPAGRLAGSPHKLLGNDLFAEMIAELRKTYSFIVIDAPPVLSSSESLVLASAADASLVCARRNFSRTGQVSETFHRLSEADANPIGVVLTGVPLWSYESEYGRYPSKV